MKDLINFSKTIYRYIYSYLYKCINVAFFKAFILCWKSGGHACSDLISICMQFLQQEGLELNRIEFKFSYIIYGIYLSETR